MTEHNKKIYDYGETIVTGDDFDMPFTFSTKSGSTVTPVNITGYTVHFILATDLDSSTTPTIEDVVTSHTAPTEGQTLGTFTTAETAAIAAGEYFLIIKWIDGSTKRKTKAIYNINVIEGGKVI